MVLSVCAGCCCAHRDGPCPPRQSAHVSHRHGPLCDRCGDVGIADRLPRSTFFGRYLSWTRAAPPGPAGDENLGELPNRRRAAGLARTAVQSPAGPGDHCFPILGSIFLAAAMSTSAPALSPACSLATPRL